MIKKNVKIGLFLSLFFLTLLLLVVFIKHDAEAKCDFSVQQTAHQKNIVPILVIGSGCAGWSAAIYGARGGVYTMVVAGNKVGGQLSGTTDVENWPGVMKKMGPVIMTELREQAVQFGTVVLNDEIIEVSFDAWPYTVKTKEGHTIKALTIIIATGAIPKVLGVPGEQEYWGNGVTTCAICDAAFHKDEDVVVIGGGDSAIEQVFQLAPYAKTITVLVRSNRMRASQAMQKQLASINHARVVYNTRVTSIEGDSKEVTGVRIINDTTKETSLMPVTGVFLAIGHEPTTKIFKGKLRLNDQGYIVLRDRSQKTSVKGVFAAGDVEDHVYRQAGVASGSGIKAALDALNFLHDTGFTPLHWKELDSSMFVPPASVGKADLIEVTDQQIFEQFLHEDAALFVDFYTQHCPTCKQMEKSVMECAATAPQARYIRIDAAKLKAVADEYHVSTVPTLLVFKDGNLIGRYNSKSTGNVKEFMAEALK